MQANLTLGDTLNFTTSVAGYPASSGWTLKFRLVPLVSGTAIAITTVPDTTDATLHRAQVSAATTAAWVAGAYSWASWVEKGAESYSVATGPIALLADPRTASAGLDVRTDARIALDQAKAALKNWTPTTKSYEIAGRRMEFNSVGEILKLISYWENQVRLEANCAAMASGLADSRKVYVRLGRV